MRSNELRTAAGHWERYYCNEKVTGKFILEKWKLSTLLYHKRRE
jgi:hypothetical protein